MYVTCNANVQLRAQLLEHRPGSGANKISLWPRVILAACIRDRSDRHRPSIIVTWQAVVVGCIVKLEVHG